MVKEAAGATGRTATSSGRRKRRSYSEEEKRRIVAEANQPGASVADIARRYGINANLLFNWRRLSREVAPAEAGASGLSQHQQPNGVTTATEPPAFIPIGMFGQAEDEGPALMAAPGAVTGADVPSRGRTPARPVLDDRPGMIEIDLVDGTRLRVDAFVNERSLRRVLTVLRATS
ncbi:transposase (plasmid) [Rhodovastum atsumiense]|uniref:Transposase n=1 Tax=Rhodovastum atsumiense TaxID=504468 RepID=A0A5M6IIM1_9PROT|nr:transposase [Rhodovastum atsumiense]KAA5607982.1 transposase [Rhodovastum atsumiense]CAH2606034.1 transposase [Rhodovastum atsumiense]